MKKFKMKKFCLAVFVTLCLFLSNSVSYAASLNVAVVNSLSAASGGTFPTTTSGPTGDFTAFAFTIMPVANVNAANLTAYDTVLLNMSSSGLGCNSNNLTASQKTDLVNFVSTGGKLIIHDSECSAVDYSWLPYPFTTSNPGALGATGTLTIQENTDLASSVPADSKYINASMMASQTDAVGDMNVLVTQDSHWCLSMSGTNGAAANGPVQTYTALGDGLIIWCGLDIDALGTGTSPDSSDPAGNIAKIWLQELQVSAADLPTGTCHSVVGTIPTMNEWGMIIFAFLIGFTTIYYLRRQRLES